MFVYSKKIVAFVQEIKNSIKEILEKEIRVRVHGKSFFYHQDTYYPISVVIFNNRSLLGYFDPNLSELGFHSCLMNCDKALLRNIIRHELAHYCTFVNYGNAIQPHGAEFREFCCGKGWGEEVYKATTCLDDGFATTALEDNSILRKVQKLMALSTSSNQNEAEQALIKSQQLLLKHNLDEKCIESDSEEKVYMKRILKQKRQSSKMSSIGRILQTFLVSPVYSRKGDHTYLEIVGSAINIEIAEYVALTLQSKLDDLWEQAKKQLLDIKGLVAKNSFFIGIARGYCHKIEALKKGYDADTSRAVMVLEKQLKAATSLVYPRLSSSTSHASYCSRSAALGEQMGRQLSINPAVSQSQSRGLQISFQE